MRVGHNPARYVQNVAQPSEITVALVNCIPFLSGYYEQSLDVLKVALDSLNATRESKHPYDVMVFDNHSCREVREYLQKEYEQHNIQYLVLSDTNVGKIGAWNFMFGAAQGKYIVFTDGDVGFRPGWLKASLSLFEVFPNVGMVTARPLPTPMEYSSSSIAWGKKQPRNVLEKGEFLSWEDYWEHARSLGIAYEESHSDTAPVTLHRLLYKGKKAYIGAAHFQFMAPRDVMQKVIPLSSAYPMRGERALDMAINEMGFLRLMTEDSLVWHMGNCINENERIVSPRRNKKRFLQWLLWFPIVHKFLLWIYNQIFRIYFNNVK